MFYWFAHGIFAIFSKIMFPITVTGREHIPVRGRFILASNHRSNLDPMILGLASGHRLNYVAKDSLFRNKFFRVILRLVGAFPIKRNTSDFRALREALRRLQTGFGLVIFPEGTRKAVGKNKKPQQGIGLIAVKSKSPVIPLFISGSENVLPAGSKKMRYSRITVTFGPPHSYDDERSYPDIAREIMEQISALSRPSPQ